jgi:hypothetical protein
VSNLTVNYFTDGATSAYVMLVNTTTSVSNNNKLEFVKNLHLILIFLFVGLYQGLAQDPQLFENDWYLQKVIIDEEDIFPPNENTIATLTFTSDLFNLEHPFCEEAMVVPIVYFGDDSFENENGGTVLIGTCAQQSVIDFGNYHYSIYHDESFLAKNPFNYSFQEDGGIVTLTVTNVDGNQGVYTSELLSVSENELSDIIFYPNPVKNVLTIKASQILDNLSISIFDVTGKSVLIKSAMSFDTYTLDIASFTSGIYFLELETANGLKKVEKIIKLSN